MANEDEIQSIEKFLERLKGYSCGNHKQLEKQMLNRMKYLKQEEKKEFNPQASLRYE